MKVKDFMSKKVITVQNGITVKEFIHIMESNNITGAPVLDHNNKVLGVISVTDVIKRSNYINKELAHCEECYEVDPTNSQISVHKYYTDELFEKEIKCLMTPQIISISPEADLLDAVKIFLDTPVHRIVVMEGEKVVGMISTKDAMRALAGEHKKVKKGA